MRPILFLLLLSSPLAMHAQRFQISETAGYSMSSAIGLYQDKTIRGGFANQLSVGIYCDKHLLFSVFYEANKWKYDDIRNYNLQVGPHSSFGIAFDFISKYFFVGFNVQSTQFATISDISFGSYSFDRAFTYGLHAGSRQRIYKHLSLEEYIGCNWFDIKGEQRSTHYTHQSSTPVTSYSDIHPKFRVYYFRVGLSYELDFGKKKKEKTALSGQ